MNAPFKLEIRASNADRVVACPLSAKLSAQLPKPPTSSAAQAGTDAHAVAATALRKWLDGDGYPDLPDAAIMAYIQYITFRYANIGSCKVRVEETLESPTPFLDASTPDCLLLGDGECEVIDFKYGQNIAVDPDSWQLRMYAILVLSKYPHYDAVRVTIVQPRIFSYRHALSKVWTKEELRAHWGKFIMSAQEAYSKEPSATIGEHCTFCPALLICPAHWQNFKSIQKQFKELEKMKPEKISLTKLKNLYAQMRAMEKSKFPDKIKTELISRLEAEGGQHGDFSVELKQRRGWTQEAMARITQLAAEKGVDIAELCNPPKLGSRELVEKGFLGNKKKLPKELQQELDLCWQPITNYKQIKITKEKSK